MMRGAVRRRAAGIARGAPAAPGRRRLAAQSSVKAAQRVIECTTRHYAEDDKSGDLKMLATA